jgi:hypothetical protein
MFLTAIMTLLATAKMRSRPTRTVKVRMLCWCVCVLSHVRASGYKERENKVGKNVSGLCGKGVMAAAEALGA